MKGPDHLLSDRSAVEAEPLQILHHGYPGRRHAITDRGCIPVGRFRAEQVGQYLHNGALALEAGGDGLVERRSHTLEAKATHRIDHIMKSEEHTSELQSLMRISYAVFCLKKKTTKPLSNNQYHTTT